MSPARIQPFSDRTTKTTDLLLARLAERIRQERRRRGWSVARLGREAGISRSAAAELEMAGRASIDRRVAVGLALGLELEMALSDPAQRARGTGRVEDLVHAAMGELEVARLGRLGFPAAVEEPYQHFQFAGRADVIGWTLEPPALLHLENRTRFPTVGDVAGASNGKRRWLGADVAMRLGIPGFLSETHVMVCLWSAEVLHELRRRPATFRSLAPDPADRFGSWWEGRAAGRGRSSSLVLLDPFATERQRTWLSLEEALTAARPRVRGCAEAVERLARRRSSGTTGGRTTESTSTASGLTWSTGALRSFRTIVPEPVRERPREALLRRARGGIVAGSRTTDANGPRGGRAGALPAGRGDSRTTPGGRPPGVVEIANDR